MFHSCQLGLYVLKLKSQICSGVHVFSQPQWFLLLSLKFPFCCNTCNCRDNVFMYNLNDNADLMTGRKLLFVNYALSLSSCTFYTHYKYSQICWKHKLEIDCTRKYPLHGYILGVLMHTTAWDRLWGGDVFLRLYVCSSALPRMTAVWQAFRTLTMWF